jgi:hypothetical protein
VYAVDQSESTSIRAGIYLRWRRHEGAERFAERRRKENEAPRLLTIAPKVKSLRLEIEVRGAGGLLVETAHARPIVVSHAPALFVFPCQDSGCKEGGHDVTAAICDALRAGKEQFDGEDRCRGHTATAECGRVLRYVATATYGA